MTLNDVQKAELALFAARAAGEKASLEQMKAIAYVVRNRVKAGWHDGQWLTVMEHAADAAGNLEGPRVLLDPSTRTLQRMIADVDDIYYRAGGRDSGNHEAVWNRTAQGVPAEADNMEDALRKVLYWCFVNQPLTPWFQENILDRPEDHAMRAQMGLMMFFE
jgi:hypothetical protein